MTCSFTLHCLSGINKQHVQSLAVIPADVQVYFYLRGKLVARSVHTSRVKSVALIFV